MNVTFSDALLLAHSTAGVLGIVAALWAFVETLNASPQNFLRVQRAAACTAFFMLLTCVLGGYWYVHFYPADRALILHGPWPFAHTLFMETKEHLFFITLILACYLPLAVRDKPHFNPAARRMVLRVAMLVVLSGLAIEGAGAVINHGVKVALLAAAGGGR